MIKKALAIQGWMSREELFWLADVASKSNYIIEFGCYKGRSTRALADNTEGKVIAVDPWDEFYPDQNGNRHGINPAVYPEFYINLKDHIDSGKVIPYKTYSTSFEPKVLTEVPDFVFLDGDHRYETVLKDILLGLHLLKNGGMLAGHDYGHRDWPGVKQAVNELLPNARRIDSIWWINV